MSAEAEPVSVVLLGYGLGGRVFHAPLIRTTPGLSLHAIVTANPERATQARTDNPGVAIYPGPDAAWTGGHRLAVISTANSTHVPYARAALTAGLDVVLDKPIAPDAATARQLADLAARTGRHLIPFQNRRWDSDMATVVAVARGNRIGAIHRFESRIERLRVQPKPGWKSSKDPADMAGVLYDFGAHAVDQALMLLGPVSTVAATVRSVRPTDPTDDDAVLMLTHVSGAVSMIVLSQVGAFGAPRMALLGTRGGLRIDASDSQEQALAAGRDPSDPAWGVEPSGTEANLRTVDDSGAVLDSVQALEPGRWPEFYRGVARALAGQAPDPVDIEDVVANMRVLDAARVAGTTGTTVRLDPPAGHLRL